MQWLRPQVDWNPDQGTKILHAAWLGHTNKPNNHKKQTKGMDMVKLLECSENLKKKNDWNVFQTMKSSMIVEESKRRNIEPQIL